MTSTISPSVIEYVSDAPHEATLRRLVELIEAAGMRVFARIDHAANAMEVGVVMRRSVVLLYGHPRGGTPVMQATPNAALELPLRVLVREGDDGRARVAFRPIAQLLKEFQVEDHLALRLEFAQRILLSATQS